jgi:hypothetical protein
MHPTTPPIVRQLAALAIAESMASKCPPLVTVPPENRPQCFSASHSPPQPAFSARSRRMRGLSDVGRGSGVHDRHPAPALPLRIDPRSGLTADDLDALEEWLARPDVVAVEASVPPRT